jgi:hypothetical protein
MLGNEKNKQETINHIYDNSNVSEIPCIEVEESELDVLTGNILKGKKISVKGYTLEEAYEVFNEIKKKRE